MGGLVGAEEGAEQPVGHAERVVAAAAVTMASKGRFPGVPPLSWVRAPPRSCSGAARGLPRVPG